MTLETRLHNIKVWFGEYWAFATSFFICSLVLLYAYGCEPKTASLISADKKVTRIELQTELELFLARARAGKKDLERQEQIRDMIFNQALVIAQGNQVNPLGVLTSILAILGIGATADDLRLRRERKKQPMLDTTDQR